MYEKRGIINDVSIIAPTKLRIANSHGKQRHGLFLLPRTAETVPRKTATSATDR